MIPTPTATGSQNCCIRKSCHTATLQWCKLKIVLMPHVACMTCASFRWFFTVKCLAWMQELELVCKCLRWFQHCCWNDNACTRKCTFEVSDSTNSFSTRDKNNIANQISCSQQETHSKLQINSACQCANGSVLGQKIFKKHLPISQFTQMWLTAWKVRNCNNGMGDLLQVSFCDLHLINRQQLSTGKSTTNKGQTQQTTP